MSNKSLHKAKKQKNDEFYTQYKDIEKEISMYDKEIFYNKIILCNTDSLESNFYLFWRDNFEKYKIKELYICGNKSNILYKYTNGNVHKIKRQDICTFQNTVDLYKNIDNLIVCTNPPFSLFRDYIDILIENKVNFLIIGNYNCFTYKNFLTYFIEQKIWFGHNFDMKFDTQNGIKQVGTACWVTNIKIQDKKFFNCIKKYKESDYYKYDNFNAINVNKIRDIPIDYKGLIGVPLNFIVHYNKNQFEILGVLQHGNNKYDFCIPYIDNKPIYI